MKKRIFYNCFISLLLFLLLPLGAQADTPETVALPIFMYHSLSGAGGSSISAEAYEADLKYLAENGYSAVTFAQLVDFVYHAKPLPPKPVVLTFDDGYYNNLAQGLPLAIQYSMPMVIAIIGRDTEIWSENPSPDLRNGHLTWGEISTMLDSGYVEIANHTWDLHKNAHGRKGVQKKVGESVETHQQILKADLGKLQEALAENCGISPVGFVYPFGATCPHALEILKEMGFLITVTCSEKVNTITQGQPQSLFELGRYNRTPDRSVASVLSEEEH